MPVLLILLFSNLRPYVPSLLLASLESPSPRDLCIALEKPAVVPLTYGLFLLKVNGAIGLFTLLPVNSQNSVTCGAQGWKQPRKPWSHAAMR